MFAKLSNLVPHAPPSAEASFPLLLKMEEEFYHIYTTDGSGILDSKGHLK